MGSHGEKTILPKAEGGWELGTCTPLMGCVRLMVHLCPKAYYETVREKGQTVRKMTLQKGYGPRSLLSMPYSNGGSDEGTLILLKFSTKTGINTNHLLAL